MKKDKVIDRPHQISRRGFLKTAAKLSVYTPPALMMLMSPSRDALALSCGHQRIGNYNRRRWRDDFTKNFGKDRWNSTTPGWFWKKKNHK